MKRRGKRRSSSRIAPAAVGIWLRNAFAHLHVILKRHGGDRIGVGLAERRRIPQTPSPRTHAVRRRRRIRCSLRSSNSCPGRETEPWHAPRRRSVLPWPWTCQGCAATVPKNPTGCALNSASAFGISSRASGKLRAKNSSTPFGHRAAKRNLPAPCFGRNKRCGEAAVCVWQRNQHEVAARPNMQRIVGHAKAAPAVPPEWTIPCSHVRDRFHRPESAFARPSRGAWLSRRRRWRAVAASARREPDHSRGRESARYSQRNPRPRADAGNAAARRAGWLPLRSVLG